MVLFFFVNDAGKALLINMFIYAKALSGIKNYLGFMFGIVKHSGIRHSGVRHCS